MASFGVGPEMLAMVGTQMSELLLRFPAVASGGVRWKVLLIRYNERYSTTLDIAALGYSNAVDAATSLLWDVARLADASDEEDPIIRIEDCIAMSPEAKAAATWPSLYGALCEIVRSDGVEQVTTRTDSKVYSILVSQLKHKLQKHWHADFDECCLSYFTEKGKLVRVKKMKHLLLALIEWRNECRLRSLPRHRSLLDQAITPTLELLPSKTHHDLSLCCVFEDVSSVGERHHLEDVTKIKEPTHKEEAGTEVDQSPGKHMTSVWDSPSEPPPFEYCGNVDIPIVDEQAGKLITKEDAKAPGTVWVWDGQQGQILPMWCVVGDQGMPNIVGCPVRQTVAAFETHKTMPSFFAMRSREDFIGTY